MLLLFWRQRITRTTHQRTPHPLELELGSHPTFLVLSNQGPPLVMETGMSSPMRITTSTSKEP